MKHYKLEGKQPLLAGDFADWALWFETSNRRVVFTQVKYVSVSTVFLGADQALLPGDPPLLFETKVFGGALDAERVRYSTWDEAERGHRAMVARVESSSASNPMRPRMDSASDYG